MTTEKRPIASQENRFVREEVAPHRPTSIAPQTLLNAPLGGSVALEQTHETVEKVINRVVGSPYYVDTGTFLLQGDCLEILPELEKAGLAVDLTITSPPYNIGKEYEDISDVDDYVAWCSEWMALLHKLTSESGAFWLNLGYFEVDGRGLRVPIPYLLWDKSPFYLTQEVVWNYGAGVPSFKLFAPRNEKWLFFVRDRSSYTFNLDAVRDPNVKYPNQKKNGKFRCNPLGKNPTDVWQIPKVTSGRKRSSKERTNHPAQFPIALVDRLVKVSSDDGELVLDPFAGSCSTGVAAAGNNRVFVGIELSEDYLASAKQRLIDFKKERELNARQGSLSL